jgi:hypothetical protein
MVTWKLTSERTPYVAPKNTLFRIDPTKKYPMIVDDVSTLIKGAPSAPIMVYTSVQPETDVGLTITPSEGVTATPLSIPTGTWMGSFTVTPGATVADMSGSISIAISGTNAASFFLAGSPMKIFGMTSFDKTPPGLASFVINTPRKRMQADLTIQVTESCAFYYTTGPRGLADQTNTTLITGGESGQAGYSKVMIGASYQYDFTVPGLAPESDYMLYGMLVDLAGHEIGQEEGKDGGEPFIIEFNTAEYYDSIMFNVRFNAPAPTET